MTTDTTSALRALELLESEELFLRVVHGDDTANEHMAAVRVLRAALASPAGEDGVWMPRAPTIPMLLCLKRRGIYPDDWERGKQMQREYGFDVIPPECNTEIAAGQYARLLDLAARTREGGEGES